MHALFGGIGQGKRLAMRDAGKRKLGLRSLTAPIVPKPDDGHGADGSEER